MTGLQFFGLSIALTLGFWSVSMALNNIASAIRETKAAQASKGAPDGG